MSPRSFPDAEQVKHRLLKTFEEKRKLFITAAVLVILGIVAVVLFLSLGRKAREDDWYELLSARSPFAGLPRLKELAERGASDFRANALLQLAEQAILSGKHDEAIEALTRIEDEFANTYVASLPSPDERRTLVRLLKERVISDREWKRQHGYDEPKPDLGRIALVETSKGAFWIAFYTEYAPKHVENFIARAKAGDFNGTKVYGITPTRILLGGASTRDDDESNDGKDPAGTTYQEPESGRWRIEQRRARVSSVLLDEGESKDRITIALAPASDLNKRQTVFGEVLKDRYPGMEAVDEIANAETYGTSDDPLHRSERFAELSDHPIEPIVVLRVSIWSGDKLEDGHTWDTSAVVRPEEDEKAPEKKDTPSGTEGPEKR